MANNQDCHCLWELLVVLVSSWGRNDRRIWVFKRL